MKNIVKLISLKLIFIFTTMNIQASNQDLDLQNTLYLDLDYGQVVIEMYPEVAPEHVNQIKKLTRQGFYDGLKFHRVIPGFMVQTGDPLGNGTGGSGQNLKQEFSDIPHDRGVASMARASDPNSADSQFFIMLEKSSHLDGQYTVWGKVVSGMEHIDKIKKGTTQNNGLVHDPDTIIKLQVASDVKNNQNNQSAM
jgi:peptidylprolyl isomerase